MSKSFTSNDVAIDTLTEQIDELMEKRDLQRRKWERMRANLRIEGNPREEIAGHKDSLKIKAMTKELTNLKARRKYFEKRKEQEEQS